MQVSELPLALLRLVALGADVVIGDAVLEHIVDGARDLGGSDEVSWPKSPSVLEPAPMD